MPVSNSVDYDSTGKRRHIGNLIEKTVQLVESSSFDGDVALEISNNGQDWFEQNSNVSGLVRIRKAAAFARVVVGGTQGSVHVVWHGIPVASKSNIQSLLLKTLTEGDTTSMTW